MRVKGIKDFGDNGVPESMPKGKKMVSGSSERAPTGEKMVSEVPERVLQGCGMVSGDSGIHFFCIRRLAMTACATVTASLRSNPG